MKTLYIAFPVRGTSFLYRGHLHHNVRVFFLNLKRLNKCAGSDSKQKPSPSKPVGRSIALVVRYYTFRWRQLRQSEWEIEIDFCIPYWFLLMSHALYVDKPCIYLIYHSS